MRDEVERRIGWGYGYGAGYVDALRGRRANNVPPPDGRVREGEHAEPNHGPSISHDFGCTHDPCRCVPTGVDVTVLRYIAHPNVIAQWTVLLDAADELERLRAMVYRYDVFLRSAFDDDPALKGALDAEWDIFVRRHPVDAEGGRTDA